jgi:hypothetical protein
VRREIRTAFFANIALPLFVLTIRVAADQDGGTGNTETDSLKVHASTSWTLHGVAMPHLQVLRSVA